MTDPATRADDDPAYDDFDAEPVCLVCGGSGELLVCWDDLCRGGGECIHGDGEIQCYACDGSGRPPTSCRPRP